MDNVQRDMWRKSTVTNNTCTNPPSVHGWKEYGMDWGQYFDLVPHFYDITQSLQIFAFNKFAKFHHYTPNNNKVMMGGTLCFPPGCDEPKKPGLDRVKRSKMPTACNAKFKKMRGPPCLFHGIQLSWGMS